MFVKGNPDRKTNKQTNKLLIKKTASVIISWIGEDMNLRETQRTSKLNIDSLKINVNDIVLVFYEKVPKHFWRIAIITQVLPSRDYEIRGAIVRIAKTNTIPKRPVNKIFAVENTYHDTKQSHKEIPSPSPAAL